MQLSADSYGHTYIHKYIYITSIIKRIYRIDAFKLS